VSAITVAGLRKSFGPVRAVDDVSFVVERGQVFALLGPNGAGKTTSIEILEGFVGRDGGAVEVLGVDPGQRHQQRWLRDRTGVVLQELAVEPYFTVRQVLQRNAGFYPAPRPVDEVIELVGLTAKADARVKTLSGGQQRRLDVGLGIVGRPEILFLDEPTTGLDPAARRTTWDLIEALADQVVVLARGRVVATGTPSSLGGRDQGRATIRFALPDGVAETDLPIVPTGRDGPEVQVVTDDEVVVLAGLTNWALDNGHRLRGLSVTRVTLEDIYLQLTGDGSAADDPR